MVGDGGGSALLLMGRIRIIITAATVAALNILVVAGGLCILMIKAHGHNTFEVHITPAFAITSKPLLGTGSLKFLTAEFSMITVEVSNVF